MPYVSPYGLWMRRRSLNSQGVSRWPSLDACCGSPPELNESEECWTCADSKFTAPSIPNMPNSDCAHATGALSTIRDAFDKKYMPKIPLQNLLPQCNLNDIWNDCEECSLPVLTMEDTTSPNSKITFATLGSITMERGRFRKDMCPTHCEYNPDYPRH